MRIEAHPILGTRSVKETISITVDDRTILAQQGDTIAAAMLAEGFRVCRHTSRTGEPRGVFCGIGQCTDCVMQVNGVPNIRTCITEVEEGMEIRTQVGVGRWEASHE